MKRSKSFWIALGLGVPATLLGSCVYGVWWVDHRWDVDGVAETTPIAKDDHGKTILDATWKVVKREEKANLSSVTVLVTLVSHTPETREGRFGFTLKDAEGHEYQPTYWPSLPLTLAPEIQRSESVQFEVSPKSSGLVLYPRLL